MTSFVIEGGHPLTGIIRPTGNKNAALPLLAACLLTDEPVILHNMPAIGDVQTMLDILAGRQITGVLVREFDYHSPGMVDHCGMGFFA